MTDKYFLTDDLYLENKHLFTIDNDESTPVNDSNFSSALSGYGWDELDFMWELQLGEKYLILDCGSSGDCLFHSISEAINLKEIYANSKKIEYIEFQDVNNLRCLASQGINNDNFDTILESYKLEDELGEFQGDWDPVDINTKEELQNEIRKCGNNFWGDHITIQLLSKALKTNFVILNSNDDSEDLSYTTVEIKGNKNYIILYYLNNCHFKLLGKFDGKKIQVIFKTIPKEILEVLMIGK
jgi:hypothetical protein